jgi:hypothetical protein
LCQEIKNSVIDYWNINNLLQTRNK